MSTADSNAQARNLDSAILFMQQDHANTLKGLHEEIALLQKKCTDLTFQLTMHGLTIDEPDEVDSQIQKVHQELTLSKEKITQLESQITERDKKIERLECDARNQRKRWLEESRTHSQNTNALRAELEAKANNIAYLTTELHRLKQKNRNNESGGAASNGEGSQNVSVHPNTNLPSQPPPYLHHSSAQGGKKNQTHHHFVPAPPQRERTLGLSGSAASRMRRPGQRSTTGSASNTPAINKPLLTVHPNSADALLGRQAVNPNPLRLSAGNRSSGSESPDITPFIPPAKEDIHVDIKQVLPPIPLASSGANTNGGAQPVLVHQVVSSTSQKKSSPSSTDAAIVTLAVSNPVPDNAWSVPQEHRSSEYN